MKKTNFVFFGLIIFALHSAGTVLGEDKPAALTLKQCLSLAREQSLELKIQSQRRHQAGQRLTQARGGLLPEIRYRYANFFRDTANGLYSGEGTDSSISLSQPLFFGFRKIETVSLSRAGISKEEFQYQNTRRLLDAEVTETFYTIAGADTDIVNIQNTLDLMNSRVRELKERVRLGKSRESEILVVESQIATLLAQQEKAAGERAVAAETLARLIGSDAALTMLKDDTPAIAEVEDGLANIRRISRTMGQPTVGMGIRKQRGTNAVAVARTVKTKLKEIQKYLPNEVNLEVRFDTTKYVEDSIREMNFVMLLSVILTALVCWLFLGSFSSALNVFLTIPMAICGTFFVLNILGFTLNTFTLLGLSLVIGIVVDDAIMMLENIARHREEGETRVRAAIKGAREITFAAIAATVAILAIFVPVIFMHGIIGKYFLQFGVTISVAVMISLLGALTLTPMYCAQFLKIGHTTGLGKAMDRLMRWLKNVYAFLLAHCLNHRWKVVFVSLLFFAGSLGLFKIIKKEFVPAQDLSRLMVRVQTEVGSSIEYTDAVYKQVERELLKHPEIESYFSNIGGDLTNTGNLMLTLKPKHRDSLWNSAKNLFIFSTKNLLTYLNGYARIFLLQKYFELFRLGSHNQSRYLGLKPADQRTISQQELMPVLRRQLKKIPGVQKVVVQDPSLMGLTARRGFPIEFTLNGPEWDKLAALSGAMTEAMEKTGLMVDIDSDYDLGMPEVRVVPDRQKAAQRGVSISVIGNTINALIGGVRVGKYTRGGRRYDIRVQLVSADRRKVGDISKIWVRNNRGEVIRLSEVVSIVQKPTLLSITRKNRERAIRMFANIAPGKSLSVALKEVEKLGKNILPEGYKLVFSGSAQTYQESFGSLYLALILGIFVAYMVLGTQFNSFIHPFTVLMALPFSISGAVLAMLVSGQSLNMYSAIGIILLMGIVKKNSILLVDFTNKRRESGMDVPASLQNACPLRLRPILMTSFSTIAAAIPPALAIGPGAETRVPMAVVVIGGVLLSTLLTLFVVPCVYSLIATFESRQHRQEVHKAMQELGT